MVEFHIPADFREETLSLLEQNNRQYPDSPVTEVYGQVTQGEFLSSGRMTSLLPEVGLSQLADYVTQCSLHGIQFHYTLNPSCTGNRELYGSTRQNMVHFLQQLYAAGVRHFTVAMPSLMELLQELFHDVQIKASAICEINGPDKALRYRQMGASQMVIDPDVTRRFGLLRRIVQGFGPGTEIIVNNMCLMNCPYKMFHYNHEAHANDLQDAGQTYYFHKCSLQKAAAPENYVRLNWIRPEDLHYYEQSGIHAFKIQGRHQRDAQKLLTAVQAYQTRSFDGDLMELITLFAPYNGFQAHLRNRDLDGFLAPFYEDDGFCTGLCDHCGYCLAATKKCTDFADHLTRNQLASAFYSAALPPGV